MNVYVYVHLPKSDDCKIKIKSEDCNFLYNMVFIYCEKF